MIDNRIMKPTILIAAAAIGSVVVLVPASSRADDPSVTAARKKALLGWESALAARLATAT